MKNIHLKSHTQYAFSYTTFQNRYNYRYQGQIGGCQGSGWAGRLMEEQREGTLWRARTTLCPVCGDGYRTLQSSIPKM